MLRKATTAALMTCLAITAWADLPGDFKAALDLYNRKDYQRATEAFLKVAGTAPTTKSKAECLAYAASSLGRQKRYDKAIALAQKIEVKPISVNCQMEIMLENGKAKELIEAFKNEDIGSWPDYVIHRGFYHRAAARCLCGDAAAAAADLEKCIASADTAGFFQIRALGELGGVYRQLKNGDKALGAYRRVLAQAAYKGLYAYFDAGISAAGILSAQDKHDEALAELRKLEPLPPDGSWRFLALETYGDVYAAQGRKTDALAKYREAAGMTAMGAAFGDRVRKKIEAVTGLPQPGNPAPR